MWCAAFSVVHVSVFVSSSRLCVPVLAAVHTHALSCSIADVRPLFRGYWAAVFRDVPYFFVNFGSYDLYRRKLKAYNHGRESGWIHFLAGGAAGATASVCTNPLDVLKTQMQTEAVWQPGARYSAPLSLQSHARRLWQSEGPRSLFRGGLAANLKIAPSGAIQFYCYDVYRRRLDTLL
jgi:Mitochondrial carrier protein